MSDGQDVKPGSREGCKEDQKKKKNAVPLQTFMVLATWPTSSYMAWSEEVLEKEWGALKCEGKARSAKKSMLRKEKEGRERKEFF